MNENNSVVAVYASHTTAEAAVKELQHQHLIEETSEVTY